MDRSENEKLMQRRRDRIARQARRDSFYVDGLRAATDARDTVARRNAERSQTDSDTRLWVAGLGA